MILNRTVTTAFNTSVDYSIKGDVITFNLLFEAPEDGGPNPKNAADGDIWQVLEDWNEIRAGYYVKSTEDGEAVWTITTAPNDANAVPDPETLPHRLVYVEDTDSFTYEACPWRSRESGTDSTNPAPSWAGEKLKAIAAHQGRLMLIGEDHITSGDVAAPRKSVFNLYDYNVDAESDADRIDLAITDATLGSPLYACSVGTDLVLICESGIDLFTSGTDPLSAFNGRDYKIRDVSAKSVPPAVTAGELFFVDELNKVHWFSYLDGGLRYQGAINDHRQDLLDHETLRYLWSIDQTLFLVTDQQTHVWERYVLPQANFLSAWGSFQFYESALVYVKHDEFVKVLTSSDGAYSLLDYYHRQPIYVSGFDYEICLDRRQLRSGTYNGASDRTMFEITGRDASASTVVVLTKDKDGEQVNQPTTPVKVQNRRVYVQGDWSDYQHYVGFVYDSYIELSRLWAGASTLMPLLTEVNVLHRDSTDYIVEIAEEGEDGEDSPWSTAHVGVESIGTLTSETGISQHLALGDARATTIKIKSNSAGYWILNGIEYRYRVRGRS